MENSLLSVGIDIGTTTTSLILSRLHLVNSANATSPPDVSINDKEIIYKSDVYFTPFVDEVLLDVEKLKEIVLREYLNIGIESRDIQTGAVIITGESALKENAKAVTEALSCFAGDFVVAAAGPDLESILAGKGSGAMNYSKTNHCTIANLDIGGGTTNIAVFSNGKLVGKTCLNIGGRLIKYDENKKVTYVSKSLESFPNMLKINDEISIDKMKNITDLMASSIFDTLEINSLKNYTTPENVKTKNSSSLELFEEINSISFSGGVAECIDNGEGDYFKFGDLGVSLAHSILKQEKLQKYNVVKSDETIRATVIGAGSHSTSVSGSTIFYDGISFPLKNIPALILTDEEEKLCRMGYSEALLKRTLWAFEQTGSENIFYGFQGESYSYKEICNIAKSFSDLGKVINLKKVPVLVMFKNDAAKAFGQALKRINPQIDRILSIDKINIREGDYIDVGAPIMQGLTIPIVVKTLLF